jgi:hypothetical protein
VCLPWVMNTNTRVIAATTAAIAGLLLAGCDNTETEETPEAPAESSAPLGESTSEGAGDGPDNETGGVGEGDGADGPDNETGGVGDGDLGEEEGAG